MKRFLIVLLSLAAVGCSDHEIHSWEIHNAQDICKSKGGIDHMLSKYPLDSYAYVTCADGSINSIVPQK